MQCPQCHKPMQTFTVRGMELDRCRDCGRVWLDLNEVERIFEGVLASLSEAEVDQPCPRGHGTMVSGTIGEQPAVVCSHCRGAWVIDTVSKEEAKPAPPPRPLPAPAVAKPPAPKANAPARHEVKVNCDVCWKPISLSEAANTNRGTVCRSCELAEPAGSSGRERISGPDLADKIHAVLRFLSN
jgi:hypothetical protein